MHTTLNIRNAAIPASLFAMLLTGCTSTGKNVAESATSGTSRPTASTAAAAKPAGQLVASGFGQQAQYVWLEALVRNTSANVGQTVTVQFNVLDASGKLIGSESQVENFSRPGQLLALGTQHDLQPHETAAKIEAHLLIEDAGAFSNKPFPEIKTGPVSIAKDEFGSTTGTFEITNPTADPLKNPRVGVICYDTEHNVIGGGAEYPDLVPASGKALVKATLNTRGKPAKCDAYAGPSI
jgi:hypothetical protein